MKVTDQFADAVALATRVKNQNYTPPDTCYVLADAVLAMHAEIERLRESLRASEARVAELEKQVPSGRYRND